MRKEAQDRVTHRGQGIALRISTHLAAASMFLASATFALAQPMPPARPGPAPPAAVQQQKPQSPVSLEQALYLIRSTLLTLNDANRSGNYSVLRDLAAPGFQNRNSAADLAHIFSDLRQRKMDLFAVALVAPQLDGAPSLTANGMLRLAGRFQTRPLQIRFELLYQVVDGQWRLFGISVATPEAPAADAQPPLTVPAPKSK